MALEQQHQNEGINPRRGWKTFLMLAGSALLGGTAVALWNRRLLAGMRHDVPQNTGPQRAEMVEEDDAA